MPNDKQLLPLTDDAARMLVQIATHPQGTMELQPDVAYELARHKLCRIILRPVEGGRAYAKCVVSDKGRDEAPRQCRRLAGPAHFVNQIANTYLHMLEQVREMLSATQLDGDCTIEDVLREHGSVMDVARLDRGLADPDNMRVVELDVMEMRTRLGDASRSCDTIIDLLDELRTKEADNA